jgi:hypothetical protein
VASPHTTTRASIPRNKILRISIPAILFLLSGLTLWLSRDIIINYLVQQRIERLTNSGIEIKHSQVRSNGLKYIDIDSLFLKDETRKLKCQIIGLRAEVDIWNTLIGRTAIQTLEINRLDLVKKPSIDEVAPSSSRKVAHSNVSREIKLPENIYIHRGQVLYLATSGIFNLNFHDLIKKESNIQVPVVVNDSIPYSINIDLDQSDFLPQHIQIRSSVEKRIGFMQGMWSFRSADIYINSLNIAKNEIRSTIKVEEFGGSHPKLSEDFFTIPSATADILIKPDGDYITIDSSSIFSINNVSFNLGFGIQPKNRKKFWLHFHLPNSNTQQCLNALPKSIFPHLKGLKIDGGWEYYLHADIKSPSADSNVLVSQFDIHDGFKIRNWGISQIPKLNHTFIHVPPLTSNPSQIQLFIDSANADYTTLSNVSPYLISSLLMSEDPAFFQHRGFYPSAFREALTENINKGYFKRGGSTISMQLIKNCFLHHSKTVGRKFEEILLVWLMENPRSVSKSRQLEIYLNIIEWGPNIFGIGQASEFYFQKKPRDLTAAESIYLVSLIPAPSLAKWSIDEWGFVSEKWTRFSHLKEKMNQRDSSTYSFDPYSVRIGASARQKLGW